MWLAGSRANLRRTRLVQRLEVIPTPRRAMKKAIRAVMLVGWWSLGGAVSASAEELVSYAFAQNDGTLRMSGETVRLWGLYIPATEDACHEFERPMRCGKRAALALEFKIGVEFVHCEKKVRYSDNTIGAICRARGEDLGAYLLDKGWAMALPDAPFQYHAAEKIARSRGFGVWGLTGRIKDK
jgi:endonuclease YncB( thermonuclease family)